MTIPPKFKQILEKEPLNHAIVLDVITSFKDIYSDNKLYFFEEYTDHGIDHIEKVLKASEFVISDDSFKDITSKEVMVLILGVILHDIGMQIDFSVFKALIGGKYDSVRVKIIDDKTWAETWTDYLSEAKRFSSVQKKNLFGNEFVPFNEPDLSNKDNLTGYDKKLIGEFIRRNHPRLAHEISFLGLMGPNGTIGFSNSKLNPIHRALAGILSRSHGTSIRDTFTYLREIGSDAWRNPDDINIIYLMVVLRIADYLQIDKDRISPSLLKLKTFNSPISLKEYNTHLAIASIGFNQPDIEKIFVTCTPLNSEMFTKLQKLFIDIQNELDKSWAVLGEVYGFLPKRLGVKFRRISSNLDDYTYVNSLSYVPKRIKFAVNDELSKLLVGPLYGNNPKYGVRELLQNSIDACVERTELEKRKLSSSYIPRVVVKLNRVDDESSIFEIVDNGKGMSLGEILTYFLSVGTSFRKSLAWKKEFVDDHGNSLVNRNGKFGIGVLAAFLIGDEISVETNRYDEDITYSFKAKIDSEFIEIHKREALKNGDNSGTKISLLLNNETRKILLGQKESSFSVDSLDIKWTDWFVHDFPKVQYILDNKPVLVEKGIDTSGWYVFKTNDFEKIQWKFQERNHNYPAIACNGIFITKRLSGRKGSFEDYDSRKLYVLTRKPSILVEDREGLLPIKLDRNDIDCYELPFEKELLSEISKRFISDVLTLEVDVDSTLKEYYIRNSNANIIYSSNGYSLDFDYFTDSLKKTYSLVKIIGTNSSAANNFLQFKDCFFKLQLNEKIKLAYEENKVVPYTFGRILLRKKKYEQLFDKTMKRVSVWSKRNHTIESANSEIVIYNINKFSAPTKMFSDLKYYDSKCLEDIESIQELPFDYLRLQANPILSGFLKKYIGGNVVIPYELEDRKVVFKDAFDELKDYMKEGSE